MFHEAATFKKIVIGLAEWQAHVRQVTNETHEFRKLMPILMNVDVLHEELARISKELVKLAGGSNEDEHDEQTQTLLEKFTNDAKEGETKPMFQRVASDGDSSVCLKKRGVSNITRKKCWSVSWMEKGKRRWKFFTEFRLAHEVAAALRKEDDFIDASDTVCLKTRGVSYRKTARRWITQLDENGKN